MAPVHVVLFYAGLLGLLLVVLSFNMMKSWVVAGRGRHGNADLRRAEALVSSFSDYVPLTLFIIGGAEASGTPPAALHALGICLVFARIMHAFGSNYSRGSDALRFIGAHLTYLVLTVASFCCLFFYAMPGLAGAW